MGKVDMKNWGDQRRKRVQRGEGGPVYLGVLLTTTFFFYVMD